MPETLDTPAQAPAAPQPRGVSHFMESMEAAAQSTGAPKEPVAQLEAKPSAAEPAKPEAPKVEAKPEVAKPAAPTPKVEGIAEVRKRLEEYQKSDKTRLSEIAELKRQNEELGKKRYVTPEMEAEIEANKREMAELRKEIASSAYERSDDYKARYVKPFENARKAALEEAAQYPALTGEDGVTRASTQQDFASVAAAPAHQRMALAQKLYGDNAFNVVASIRDLEKMRREAVEARDTHHQEWEKKSKAEQEQWQGNQKRYESSLAESIKALEREHPEVFGDSEDPEISSAWKAGREAVANLAKEAENATPEERAAMSAVANYKAAWFPRGRLQIKKLETKVTELESELAKYRGSEPGAERPTAGASGPTKDAKGVDAMTSVFDKLGSM
jgi:hypothetical protein